MSDNAAMEISRQAIIEEIIDPLAMGDLGESVDAFHMTRPDEGTLLLDYGQHGRFILAVTKADPL
jgi:hypothetical protein